METSEVNCVRVTMNRRDTGQAWGFRMTGGRDLGCFLYIAKVNPRSLSARFGLRTGDRVVMIEGLPAHNLNHDQAKAEILRAGNDLHLVVERGTAPVAEDPMANRRSVVVEERTEYRGDTNPTSQSRTFHLLNQFLQDELEILAPEKPKAPKVVNGPKPTDEHGPVSGSAYTSAQKPAAPEAAKQPAPAPAKEPVKANPSPAAVPAPAKESMQATVAKPAEAPPKKPMEKPAAVPPPASKPEAKVVAAKEPMQATVAKLAEAPPKKLVEKPAAVPPPASKPETKVVAAPANVQAKTPAAAAPVAAPKDAGAKTPTAAKETAPVQAKAKSSGEATGAVLAQAEAKSSNLVKEAVKEAALIQAGAKSSDAGSKAAPKDVPDSKPPAAAEVKAPEATTESVNVKVEESAPILVASTEETENFSFEISAETDTNFSVDLPADNSASIEVSESVDEPFTIVAIAGNDDIAEEEEGEYSDEDYTDGSASEEEAATFTLQLS